MKKEIVNIKGLAKPPSPFNHVVKAGNFLFLSSQLSVDLEKHKILGGDIESQTRQALKNIKFLIESAGASLNDIVKTSIFMKDVKKDFEGMNKVYKEFFNDGKEPARVTVQALSPLEKIDIEIDAIAIAGKENEI